MSIPVPAFIPFIPEFRWTLGEGASEAATSRDPVRLWYADDDTFAEVFFFGQMLLHAEVNGRYGIAAIAELTARAYRYALDRAVWPVECTLVMPWERALREARACNPNLEDRGAQASSTSGVERKR
jgi:hypothetical protein